MKEEEGVSLHGLICSRLLCGQREECREKDRKAVLIEESKKARQSLPNVRVSCSGLCLMLLKLGTRILMPSTKIRFHPLSFRHLTEGSDNVSAAKHYKHLITIQMNLGWHTSFSPSPFYPHNQSTWEGVNCTWDQDCFKKGGLGAKGRDQKFPGILHFLILTSANEKGMQELHWTWAWKPQKFAWEPKERNWKCPGISENACILCVLYCVRIHILCKPA